MNKLRKLAVRGMRGRRKDTRVLALVIGMGFLFLTAGTLLLSSFHGSQAQQRQNLYGNWHLLYGGGDAEVCRNLEGLTQTDEAVTVTMLGSDEKCGHVAVWDEDFARLGNLRILEGRAPEAKGEILLERGQLGLFSEEIGVGSQISLTMNYHMEGLRERQYPTPSITIRGGELPARQVMKTFADGVTEEGIQSIMERIWTEEVWNGQFTYKDENGELHTEWSYDAPLRCPISEMDDESYRTAVLSAAQYFSNLNGYLEYTVRDDGGVATTEVNRSFFEGDTHGEVNWGLNTQYDYLYAKSAQFASEELQQIVMTRGAVPHTGSDLDQILYCGGHRRDGVRPLGCGRCGAAQLLHVRSDGRGVPGDGGSAPDQRGTPAATASGRTNPVIPPGQWRPFQPVWAGPGDGDSPGAGGVCGCVLPLYGQ